MHIIHVQVTVHVKQRNDYTRSKETEKTASRQGAYKVVHLITDTVTLRQVRVLYNSSLTACSKPTVSALWRYAAVDAARISAPANDVENGVDDYSVRRRTSQNYILSDRRVPCFSASGCSSPCWRSKSRLYRFLKTAAETWHVLMAAVIYCAISYCNRIKVSVYKYLRRKPRTTQINFPTFSLVFANNTSEIFF